MKLYNTKHANWTLIGIRNYDGSPGNEIIYSYSNRTYAIFDAKGLQRQIS
ncbi:hypothetical protein [Vallitalea longa]|nr:hypothetical protein [Vallitalea longa]